MNHNHSWRTMVGFSPKKHAIFSPGRGSRVDHRTNSRATDYFIGALGQHQHTKMEIGWEKHPGNKTKNSKTGLQQWLEPNEMMWPCLTTKKNLGKGPRLAKFWFHGTNVTPLPAWHTEIAGSLQRCSTGKGLPQGQGILRDGDRDIILPRREIRNMSKHQSYWSKHQRCHVWWESCNVLQC